MQKAQSLENFLSAGRVRRYHTLSGVEQSVAEHSFNLAGIVLFITHGEASANLIKAALYHDLEEIHTGDVPFQAKRTTPAYGEVVEHIGNLWREQHGLEMPELDEEEAELLHHADMIEAALYGVHLTTIGFKYYGAKIVQAILSSMDGAATLPRTGSLLEMIERYMIETGVFERTGSGDETVH